jgi:hypothetical protein
LTTPHTQVGPKSTRGGPVYSIQGSYHTLSQVGPKKYHLHDDNLPLDICHLLYTHAGTPALRVIQRAVPCRSIALRQTRSVYGRSYSLVDHSPTTTTLQPRASQYVASENCASDAFHAQGLIMRFSQPKTHSLVHNSLQQNMCTRLCCIFTNMCNTRLVAISRIEGCSFAQVRRPQ